MYLPSQGSEISKDFLREDSSPRPPTKSAKFRSPIQVQTPPPCQGYFYQISKGGGGGAFEILDLF